MLLLGACIYVLFREPVIFTEPLKHLGIHPPIISLTNGLWSYILKFVLPDALWVTALLLYASSLKLRAIRILALLMAPLFEVGQFFGLVEGYFDFIDLIVYIIITTFFILQWKRKEKSLQRLPNS